LLEALCRIGFVSLDVLSPELCTAAQLACNFLQADYSRLRAAVCWKGFQYTGLISGSPCDKKVYCSTAGTLLSASTAQHSRLRPSSIDIVGAALSDRTFPTSPWF